MISPERVIAETGPQSAIPFGPYLLLKRLAVGGMAELYLAKETRADRLVVIKRILPYLAEEIEFVRMFLDEARIAAQLHHANVVEVYELGQLEDSIFIAMEFVDGIDLRRVLQKENTRGGVVPPGIAAWLVARLCEGLHYAHFKGGADGKPMGIIHRDVSPQNLMVSYDAEVKLVDFGIAKATAWMSRSKPGVIKGKFLYLAPEQLTQEVLDHRTDLFAVGTLLYELTTGKSPFYRQTTEAVIYSIRMEEAKLPRLAHGEYPRTLSDIVMKCLEKDREHRYQTAEEIRRALDSFLAAEQPTTHQDVAEYTAGLFGGEEERTSIFIPPNARSKIRPARPPAEPPEEESTKPMRNPSLPRQAEGRRPTAEVAAAATQGDDQTNTGRMQRDVAMTGPLDPVVTPERTSPDAAAGRDGERTAVLEDPPARKPLHRARSHEPEETVLMSGAERAAALPAPGPPVEPEQTYGKAWSRRPEPSVISPLSPDPEESYGKPWSRQAEPSMGDLPPLTPPTPSRERAEPSISTAPSRPGFERPSPPPAPQGPLVPRPVAQQRPSAHRLSPPIPTPSDDHSAPMIESGILDLAETNNTVEQLAPVSSPAARKGPVGPQRRPRPKPTGDADDLIDTVDFANINNLSSDTLATAPDDRKKWLVLAAVCTVGFLLMMALVWALWPSPAEDVLRNDDTPQVQSPRAPDSLPAADDPSRTLVMLELRAPRGTLLEIDGREVGDRVQVPPGKVTVSYRCPIKRRGPAKRKSVTVDVPAGQAELLVVPLSCR